MQNPKGNFVASPFSQQPKKPREPHKHDRLCVTVAIFLRYCWCMCPQCWNKDSSHCVCAQCHCRKLFR